MKQKYLMIAVIITMSILFGCNNEGVNEPSDGNMGDTSHTVVARKPNIYLYPPNKVEMEVFLSFPKGGHITESIPKYTDGWLIDVEPSGRINDNYDYLYYECEITDIFQKSEGWLIKGVDVERFFNANLESYGFNENEKSDFLEYWVPRIENEKDYYVYPQLNSIINQVIELKLSIVPEESFRLFYLIEAAAGEKVKLMEPKIKKIRRNGFTLVEWGVIVE